MSKFCKPIGLYVTYLDCLECEEKECRQTKQINVNMEEQGQKKTALFVQDMENVNTQKREERAMKKVYLEVEPNDIVYIVVKSKREGHNKNVVLKCVVESVAIKQDKKITYYAKALRNVTDKTCDMKQYDKALWFNNANINTGLRGTFENPVFTTKEDCLNWLKK